MKSQSLLLSIVAFVSLSSSLFGEFKIIAGWDQQLFPSYIIANATIKDESKSTEENLLGDRNGLLGIELVAPNDQTPIEITIAGNEFIESSTLISRLPKKVFPIESFRRSSTATSIERLQAGEGGIVHVSGQARGPKG